MEEVVQFLDAALQSPHPLQAIISERNPASRRHHIILTELFNRGQVSLAKELIKHYEHNKEPYWLIPEHLAHVWVTVYQSNVFRFEALVSYMTYHVGNSNATPQQISEAIELIKSRSSVQLNERVLSDWYQGAGKLSDEQLEQWHAVFEKHKNLINISEIMNYTSDELFAKLAKWECVWNSPTWIMRGEVYEGNTQSAYWRRRDPDIKVTHGERLALLAAARSASTRKTGW
jgi:hypothetical protein